VADIALIMAAGQGTRMKSRTPKVLHQILDTPLVHYVISAAEKAGCARTLVVTGHQRELVEAVLPDGVEKVFQPERIGTANTVLVAEEALAGAEGKLVVLSGDVPLLQPETIAALLDACTGHAMVVLTAHADDPRGYGRVLRNEYGAISGIVEEKDATEEQRRITEVNTGVYCFELEGLFDRLRRIDNDNTQQEYYLTDIVGVCVDEGASVGSITVADASETMGVNSRVQLAEASRVMQRRINEAWMTAGVTMAAPELCWIAPDVTLAPDTTLLPMTVLAGATKIEGDCVIGPDTRIVSSCIGAGSVVDSSIVRFCEVGERCSIGPRAYLRPGCVLENDVKIGTSVELKATRVGAGAKIPHLSYIGDAQVGPDVNIGAGSITCNYDGQKKHETRIGAGAFIGSDTMLVAPVEIGAGAVTGAGSTITKDIPDGALAVERNEQTIIEEWTKRHRKETH